MKVRFFASVRELLGVSSREIPIEPNQTVSSIIQMLVSEYPQIIPLLETSLIALNMEYISDFSKLVAQTDELAIIPPVSGG